MTTGESGQEESNTEASPEEIIEDLEASGAEEEATKGGDFIGTPIKRYK